MPKPLKSRGKSALRNDGIFQLPSNKIAEIKCRTVLDDGEVLENRVISAYPQNKIAFLHGAFRRLFTDGEFSWWVSDSDFDAQFVAERRKYIK